MPPGSLNGPVKLTIARTSELSHRRTLLLSHYNGSSDKECYGKYNLPLTLMKLMEELFTCPICKLSFGHKARLRKHIKKHTKSLEKNLAKANSTKKAEHEKMLIQERIARTGSAFKNESERNKYFERRRGLC